MWNKARAELAKMRRMPFGEAVDYFWTYYKIHVLFLAVCVFFLVLIFQAFSAAAGVTPASTNITESAVSTRLPKFAWRISTRKKIKIAKNIRWIL